jgi:hypothetical protein
MDRRCPPADLVSGLALGGAGLYARLLTDGDAERLYARMQAACPALVEPVVSG